MANRRFNQFVSSLENKPVLLDGYVQLDPNSLGVVVDNMIGASTARIAAGRYQTTLEDKYPGVLSAHVQLVSATNQNIFAQIEAFMSDGVHSLVNVNRIDWKLVTSGTPVDPIVVCGVAINLVMKNSRVPNL